MSDNRRNDDREACRDLPIACSLGPAELATRRDALLPGLLSRATDREPMGNVGGQTGKGGAAGFRWRFDFEPGLLTDIAAVMEAEHRCCPFLRFGLVVTPGEGPVFLDVTGPEGTTDFLAALLDKA